MTLPQNSYVNSLWQKARGAQTLLTYTAVDNGLPFFPGYKVNSKVTRITSGNKFVYRRLQTHSVLLDRPVQAALNITDDKVSCLISLDVASVSYIQETQQTSLVDLSPQIIASGKFKDKSTYELWDDKDFWYVSEQALHTQFAIPNRGSPTRKEYLQVLDQAELQQQSPENEEEGIDVDYRLYRPLPLLPIPLPLKLKQTFKVNQTTIEDLLRTRLTAIDLSQQDWQITPIESYNSPTFPATASSEKTALANFLNSVLQNIDDFIIV